MYRMCAAYGGPRSLRHSNVPDFPGPNEIGHRPNRFFDWNLRVNAMQIIQIDDVDAQALQREIATAACVARAAVDAPVCSGSGSWHDSEFSCENDVFAAASEGLSNLYLRVAIDVRRVEKVHTEVKS